MVVIPNQFEHIHITYHLTLFGGAFLSTHFVAHYGQDLYFFYPSDNLSTLHYRIWREGRYSPENTLLSGVKLPFSVFHHGGLLHVFCQDIRGNIMLFNCREGQWNKRTILQGNESVLITPMISEENLCIIYNGFAETDGQMPCLFKRTLDMSNGTGEWHPPDAIDHFKPFSFMPYEAQVTGPGHLLLFYQTYADECQIGYREVTPRRIGPFHRFLNSPGTLVDVSYLTTWEAVHILLIIRTAFSCQLLYRKKTDDVFTPPALLWESPKIERCLLTVIEDQLHATCILGGKLHRAISSDDGDFFGSMSLYKRKFCAEPVKANFVFEEEWDARSRKTSSWFARQVYVDRAAPWDIQMVPDLCQNFYPQMPQKADEATQLQELHDRLTAAEQALVAKDRQIMELLYKTKMGGNPHI